MDELRHEVTCALRKLVTAVEKVEADWIQYLFFPPAEKSDHEVVKTLGGIDGRFLNLAELLSYIADMVEE